MSISAPRLTGPEQLVAISRSMAGLQREHYGRESSKVNAYAIKDMIVVVARSEHLTPLEKTLVDGGEPERVLALRTEFARVMAGRYTHTVEQVTGRTVVALVSQAHVDPDIIVDLFILDRPFGSMITAPLAEVIDLPEASRPAATSVSGSIDVTSEPVGRRTRPRNQASEAGRLHADSREVYFHLGREGSHDRSGDPDRGSERWCGLAAYHRHAATGNCRGRGL